MNITTTALVCGVSLVVVGTAAPALAHHSYAMFDLSKQMPVTGTVKAWEWTNPHTFLVLVSAGPDGKPIEYGLEGASPEVLRSRGWVRTVVKPGDKISIRMHPLKSGAKGGQLDSITTAGGKTYDISNPLEKKVPAQ